MLPIEPDDSQKRQEPISIPKVIDRIIEMAWEDRTPFEAIEMQYGLKENQVRAIMRKHMKRSSFHMWRKRVKGRTTKHKSSTATGTSSASRVRQPEGVTSRNKKPPSAVAPGGATKPSNLNPA